MIIADYQFVTEMVSLFHGFLLVEGWFHHTSDELSSIEISGNGASVLEYDIGFTYEPVRASLGDNRGFRIKAFLEKSEIHGVRAILRSKRGWTANLALVDLVADRHSMQPPDALYLRFRDQVRRFPGALLEVGGRDRSGVDLAREFGASKCTVFDLASGPNVHVVGDAHFLGKHFAPASFDFVHSASVFEHLAMPWVVASEINRVLKPGGLAFISSHQTVGLHNLPRDYWRFSDRAYHALFNESTGFELLDTTMNQLNFIVPFLYADRHRDSLMSAGFEVSAALIRKTRSTDLQWKVDVAAISQMRPTA
jgi:hypothetical protein